MPGCPKLADSREGPGASGCSNAVGATCNLDCVAPYALFSNDGGGAVMASLAVCDNSTKEWTVQCR